MSCQPNGDRHVTFVRILKPKGVIIAIHVIRSEVAHEGARANAISGPAEEREYNAAIGPSRRR